MKIGVGGIRRQRSIKKLALLKADLFFWGGGRAPYCFCASKGNQGVSQVEGVEEEDPAPPLRRSRKSPGAAGLMA